MRYSAETTAPPADVLRRAREAFGAGGAGLRLSALTLTTARFEAAAGHVLVEATRARGQLTAVVIETREFDDDARRFLLALPRQPWWRRLRRA